jgi:regulator of protease activity HflC (stomatin/prohibitin superfamily)
MMTTWIALLVLLLFVVLLAARLTTTIVFEYERGVRFSRGRFDRVVGPGLYRHWGTTVIRRVDIRPSRVIVPGQEVLSGDGVAIKGSIAAVVVVTDPQAAVLRSDNYLAAIHTELQLALRAIASSLAVEELLKQRAEIPAQLKAIAGPRLAAFGIDLQDASIRDFTFPGDLKKIFAQVVKARQEGLAALEKARGETAALRNLANAAQMIERTPSLMQLRALQVLGQQPGNTLVLGMPQQTSIVPLRAQDVSQVPAPPDVPPETE